MHSRVSKLKLRLAVQAADSYRLPELRRLTEAQFVTGVLDVLESQIHARFGAEAIVRIHNLSVRWGVEAGQLEDRQYIEKTGCELADQIEHDLRTRTRRHTLLPPATVASVLFENQAHQYAVQLSDQLVPQRRREVADAWFHADSAGVKRIWSAACSTGATTVKSVLDYLLRMDTLQAVIAGLDDAQLEQATRALPLAEWPAAAAGQVLERHRARDPQAHLAPEAGDVKSTATGADPRPVDGEPPWSPEAETETRDRPVDDRSELPRKTAEDSLQPQQSPESGTVQIPFAGTRRVAAVKDSERRKDEQAADRADEHRLGGSSGEDPLSESQGELDDAMRSAAPEAPVPASATGDSVVNDDSNTDFAALMSPAGVETQFAGVFYLLNAMLQLELPEILWCAGVKEGDFLVLLTRLLLGEEGWGDPAPRVLAPVTADFDPDPQAPPDWAAQEIRQKLLLSLYSQQNRQQVSGDSTSDLEHAIEHLKQGVIGGMQRKYSAHDAVDTAAFCAAAIVYQVGMRLGEPMDRDSLVNRIRVPGRIEHHADEIQVCITAEAVDVQFRVAGLDLNPGYLPWLKKKLVLIFEGQDEE